VLIANGDTIFKIDLDVLHTLHENSNVACTLALKPMQTVWQVRCCRISTEAQILSLRKSNTMKRLDQWGIYLQIKQSKYSFPKVFSFEKITWRHMRVSFIFLVLFRRFTLLILVFKKRFWTEAHKDLLIEKSLDLKNIDPSGHSFLDRDINESNWISCFELEPIQVVQVYRS